MIRLELAQMSNNSELLQFYSQFPLDSHLSVKLDRGREFFRYYETQTDQFVTYLLRDQKDNRILGIVSFLIEKVKLEGQIKTVAWARDLRISSDRKAILTWTEHTQNVFNEVRKLFGVDYFLSSLNMSEIKALNTFTRPRSQKRSLPRYFLYRKFDLVTLHGQFPFSRPPLPSLKIRRGNPNQKESYISYLMEKSKTYSMSHFTSADDIEESIERWSRLSWEDFFIAFDSQDRIVGLLSSWSPAGYQDYIPLRYSLQAHNFRQFLKFGKLFQWTRTLTKPVHRLKMEAALNFRMLNHICVDHADVFGSLLWRAYQEARDNEFLLYVRDKKSIHLKPPLGWISSELPYGIYCTLLPDEEIPSFLHPSNDGLINLFSSRFI